MSRAGRVACKYVLALVSRFRAVILVEESAFLATSLPKSTV
jgi:hypothetical protein